VQYRFFAAVAMLSLAAQSQALAQPATTPIPDSIIMRCRDCGVINSIREVQRQREGAASNVGAGSPIGLVIYIPSGPARGDAYVGSVGSREWQNITTITSYEFTVRMDDGDFRSVQKEGVSDLRVGERVRMNGGRIERWGQ
jgi:outer membrane lipoprotein SlyB